MSDQRYSDYDVSRRDVPSFIEPLPPLISNPFMRPKPQTATNLMKLFEEDLESEEPELLQVYLRLKPCNIRSDLYEVRSDRYLVTSLDTTTAGHGRRTQHNVSKMYTFSHIFGPDSNQKEIFENVVKENLRKLPDGHSFTLLTYGASGSGKTYTLMGTVASPGLVPRSLEYVFRVIEAAQQPLYKPAEGGAHKLNYAEQDYELQWVKRLRQISAPLRDKYRRMSAQLCNDMTASTTDLSNRTRYYVWVSFVEIYNEGIYDLLAPGERRNASKLLIREDSNGNVYVKGATQAFVRTGSEAYDVMVAGKHNLQVAATGVHAQSSRSHCIFTITMLTQTENGVSVSCVRLCDLAGCERARRTRNTGARMQESRAINSSLHVLERCLHTLRRKQRANTQALVPYRESKLTRLLGAGLSGARGEAVSMVVTLNPAPEYAHETKHVLQLAAVARDIQINNTLSECASSLETSASRDTTYDDAELLRLRSDNERLHFELMQAQTRNMELVSAMEEKQLSTADTMRSLVKEAREITTAYYETQLQALRNEMEEMVEEYEGRLRDVIVPPKTETPNRALQNKVTQLMTEIAILEEKLTAESLARARAEEEVQHLRACIEERDENAANNNEDVISVTDSDLENDKDSDAEDDPCNESLEPTFTKEDINRSRLIRQSTFQDNHSTQDDSVNSADESVDSVLEKLTDTAKDDNFGSLDNTYVTGNESGMSKRVNVTDFDVKSALQSNSSDKSVDDDSVLNDINKIEKDEQVYVENDIGTKNDVFVNFDGEKVKDIKKEVELKSDVLKNKTDVKQVFRGTYFVTESKIDNKLINNSVQEQLLGKEEKESKKSLNEKQSFNATMKTFDSYESITKKLLPTETIDTEASISKESCNTTHTKDDKKDVSKPNQWEVPRKASETFVNKIIDSLKCSTNSDSSLAQFEQLEKATKDWKGDYEVEPQDEFYNTKLLKKEKRTYFDDSKKEYQREILSKSVEHKTYFDNISANIDKVPDKRPTEVDNNVKIHDDLRSPSIVKEEVTNDFEPSTIKRLLGESMTRQPEPATVVKAKNIVTKKYDSIDVFESPLAANLEAKKVENIDKLLESVAKFVINSETENVVTTVTVEKPSLNQDDEEQAKPQHEAKTKSYVSEQKPVFISPKKLKSDVDNVVPALNVQPPLLDDSNTKQDELQMVSNNKSHVKEDKHVFVSPKKLITEPDHVIPALNGQESGTTDKDEVRDMSQTKTYAKDEKETLTSNKIPKTTPANIDASNISEHKSENTFEEFENIYNNVTEPRATEFELLVSQEVPESQVNDPAGEISSEEVKYNLRHKSRSKLDKSKSKYSNDSKKGNSKNCDEEVLLESYAKCESKQTTRRNLRLRRRKDMMDDDGKQEERYIKEGEKLKDIINLQHEFSDVTIDVPAPVKVVKDIPSPEKGQTETENLPPILGIQSCPVKSITRSRRKLFTPRAEPLEESLQGESGERVCVPRPSYHRPRARRKL